MNQLNTEGKNAGDSVVASTTNTRLTGPWLHIARVVWLALVVPSVGLFVANLFAYDQQLQKACDGSLFFCNLTGALTAKEFQALSASGFSVRWYAALLTISLAVIVSIWCGVGFLIVWRRSDDWLALLAAFFLLMFSITPSGNNPGFLIVFAYPFLALPITLICFLGQISIGVFFSFFPSGRLVPRWIGLVLLLYIIYAFFNNFPSPTSPFDMSWPAWLNLLLATLVFPGAIVIAQIYRYRRVSTSLQRQQTKWILLGTAVAIGILISLSVIALLTSSQQYSLSGVDGVIVSFIFFCSFLLIPLSIGFSILRYRLYDIDLLINRTLVYSSLTALLVLIYLGLVFSFQFLLDQITGQVSQYPVVLVASTLVIAALFQPLRRRIQNLIDRRFYRSKYDARRTIANFSASLRGEVDLAELSEQLVTIVQETMQPAHVSLWLNQPRKTPPGYSEEAPVSQIS